MMAAGGAPGPFQALRAFVTDSGRRRGPACDLCGQPFDGRHRHLVELSERRLRCSCTACALLFDRPGAGGASLRLVPDRYGDARALGVDEDAWEVLDVPVQPACCLSTSSIGPVALCPGPAGMTEHAIDRGTWESVVAVLPEPWRPADDVEALVARRGAQGFECFLVPVDACYRLAGALRAARGPGEAQVEVDAFFADLSAMARSQVRS